VYGDSVSFAYWLAGAPVPETAEPQWPGMGAWVVAFPPSWDSNVSLSVELSASRNRTLTGREARAASWNTPRLRMRWTSSVKRERIPELRDALETVSAGTVLVPVWPLAVRSSDFNPSWHVDGKIWAGFDAGGTNFIAGLANAFTRTSREWFVPALLGRLVSVETDVLTPELARVQFEFLETETPEWGLVLPALTWADGPALDDSFRPKVFPLSPDWGGGVRARMPEVVFEDVDSPLWRSSGRLVYPQSPFRGWQCRVPLNGPEATARLLAWISAHRLSGLPHYAPWALWSGKLAATAAAGSTSLVLEDGATLGNHRFLWLMRDGMVTEVARVVSVTANLLTLSEPLQNDWPAGRTVVGLAMLGRHEGDRVEIGFLSPEIGMASLEWLEVPEEYLPASGETRGGTLGGVASLSYAVQVTVYQSGVPTVLRFTPWESPLKLSGDVFEVAPLSIKGASWSVELEATNLSLEIFSEKLVAALYPPKQFTDAEVKVWRGTVNGENLDSATVFWQGTLESCDFDGPKARLTVGPPLPLLRAGCPRRLFQPQCNHVLFDAGCGLNRADWQIAATVYSASGNSVTLANFSRPGGLPAGFGAVSGWFDGGELQRGSDGTRFHVASSTALDSNSRLTVTLANGPETDAFTPGESVTLVPGCNGFEETCKAYHATNNPKGRFDNWLNFGGFPFMPWENPAFDPPDKRNDTYGKK
jgi:hypothetical protein